MTDQGMFLAMLDRTGVSYDRTPDAAEYRPGWSRQIGPHLVTVRITAEGGTKPMPVGGYDGFFTNFTFLNGALTQVSIWE